MSRNVACSAAAVLLLSGMLVGCAESKPQMEMTRPTRPAELDKLEMFAGTWEGTMECRTPGSNEVMKGTGTNQTGWEADRWVMVERWTGDMGEMGKMSGIGVWTWDAKHRVYRSHWLDSWGNVGEGTATYDEHNRTWSMKSESENAAGHETRGSGTIKFVDHNTMEWSFSEYAGGKKMRDMKGTSRRK